MLLAINPFRNKAKTENETEIKIEKDLVLEEVIERYLVLEKKQIIPYKEYESIIEQIQTPVLTPVQINTFLQYLIEEDKLFSSEYNKLDITGRFLSKLIQQSYNDGNNDFILNTKDAQINELGHKLKGTKQNKIKILIQGNVGHQCGFESEHSQFDIQGNAETSCGWYASDSYFTIGNAEHWCGSHSKYSQFDIHRNTGNYCGWESNHSQFIIQGNTGNNCGGYSEHSQYTIQGNMGTCCGYDSINSTYKTKNPDTYEKMTKSVPKKNQVQLLDIKGNILRKRCNSQ